VLTQGAHPVVDSCIQAELSSKIAQGCATGILNCPDASHLPETDRTLVENYDPTTHAAGKKANKMFLQERLGLIKADRIPLLFWPSCLDRIQNYSYFISTMLYSFISRYQDQELEIIFTARGTLEKLITDIAHDFNIKNRVAVCRPDDSFVHLAYAASDFVLMPFAVEPVSSGKITGLLYGSLPIVHDQGDNNIIITPLDPGLHRGNGFLFNQVNDDSLISAIDAAMAFYNQSIEIKTREICRIMRESRERFDPSSTIDR
jgi:glycogen synthase